MTRTEHYFELVKNYRGELRNIWAEYDNTVQKLGRYKGSEGYTEEVTKAAKKRDSAIADLQTEYRTRFACVVAGMKESALNLSMIAPTQEQLAILSALKMRETLTRDELEQAGRSLKGCPVALAVVNELAKKHELHGVHNYGGLSTTAILEAVDTLADNAKRLCVLRRCDSKREMAQRASVFSPEWDPSAMRAFRVDVDPENLENAMGVFGGVENLEDFSAAVDN